MATDTTKTYNEVHFALYFDRELDQEAEAQFEVALKADAELLAHYNEWVDTYEALNAHFEAVESSYPLEGFTDRVMADLPELSAQTQASPSDTTAGLEDSGERVSWFRQIFIPFLIGSLAAAALFIALNRQVSSESGGDTNASGAELGNSTDGLTPISDNKGSTWPENDDEEDEDDEGGI
jgi:anti-sigma factor RsiW